MPLYEYQCEACGHRFEKIQKFSDPPLEACPSCGGAVRKLVSSPAFQFKGSGWYVTDYARSGKADTSASEDGKTGSTEKSEGKPAAETPSKPEAVKDTKRADSPADSKGTPSADKT